MSATNLLTNRKSARDFSTKPVSEAILTTIITEAATAPSWENTQPWHAYLATGATAARLRASHLQRNLAGQKSWTEVTPPKTWAPVPQQHLDHWRTNMMAFFGDQAPQFAALQKNLFHAPAIVYLTIPQASSAYSAYDAGAFGYGLLLAAEQHGVSGVPAYELVRYPAEIRAEFTIPSDEALFMGIALGYLAPSPLNDLKTDRMALDDLLQIRR